MQIFERHTRTKEKNDHYTTSLFGIRFRERDERVPNVFDRRGSA